MQATRAGVRGHKRGIGVSAGLPETALVLTQRLWSILVLTAYCKSIRRASYSDLKVLRIQIHVIR